MDGKRLRPPAFKLLRSPWLREDKNIVESVFKVEEFHLHVCIDHSNAVFILKVLINVHVYICLSNASSTHVNYIFLNI